MGGRTLPYYKKKKKENCLFASYCPGLASPAEEHAYKTRVVTNPLLLFNDI